MEAALIVTKNACFNQNINNMVASVNTLIVEDSEFDRIMYIALQLNSTVNSAMIERCILSSNGLRGKLHILQILKSKKTLFSGTLELKKGAFMLSDD